MIADEERQRTREGGGGRREEPREEPRGRQNNGGRFCANYKTYDEYDAEPRAAELDPQPMFPEQPPPREPTHPPRGVYSLYYYLFKKVMRDPAGKLDKMLGGIVVKKLVKVWANTWVEELAKKN